MSDYTVKECPCEACKKTRAALKCTCDYDARNNERDLDVNCPYHIPAKVTEQASAAEQGPCICGHSQGITTHAPNRIKKMAAALAVAQQVRDVQWEKAIRHEMPSEFTDLGIDTFVATLRARIAKPADQTDENRVAEIICKRMQSFHCVDTTLDKIAAEIVAALRDGKEGK